MTRAGSLVVSLYDYTGVALRPWAEAGYHCLAVDIQHRHNEYAETFGDHGEGVIEYVGLDLHRGDQFGYRRLQRIIGSSPVAFVSAFPVCTDLAASGARHWAKKRQENPSFQTIAAMHAKRCADIAIHYGAPYYIENPVGALSTLWRKPDFTFHPFQFGGYIPKGEESHPDYPDRIPRRDAYSKRTCLWTGGGFRMPAFRAVECETYGASRQFRTTGGKSQRTKNIRSATPRGFARAVFEANNV